MTESDEDSLKQAEANIGRPAAGDRAFKVIRATIAGDQARSIVTSVAAPAAYSFRQVDGTRSGAAGCIGGAGRTSPRDSSPRRDTSRLLVAVAELMHRNVDAWHAFGQVQPGGLVNYVYHGRIYELRATRTQPLASVRVGGAAYAHVIRSDFEIRSTDDGESTHFRSRTAQKDRWPGGGWVLS
jgi:hypothetical protein